MDKNQQLWYKHALTVLVVRSCTICQLQRVFSWNRKCTSSYMSRTPDWCCSSRVSWRRSICWSVWFILLISANFNSAHVCRGWEKCNWNGRGLLLCLWLRLFNLLLVFLSSFCWPLGTVYLICLSSFLWWSPIFCLGLFPSILVFLILKWFVFFLFWF